MGQVWETTDTKLNRKVEVLRRDCESSPFLVETLYGS